MTIRWAEDQLKQYESGKRFGQVVCKRCGITEEKTGPKQVYCKKCSAERDRERKRKWSSDNGSKPETIKRHYEKKRSSICENGERISKGAASPIHNYNEPDLKWLVRFRVPFSYAASKNHIYAMSRSGHVTLRRESRAMRAMIAEATRSAIGDTRVANNKVWLDIFVQKPNHKGDAVNVVDLVCDAIKDAIPVDDRWYCIRRLDWEVVKGDTGMMFIGIGQDTDVDVQVCSSCGRILPLTEFTKNVRNKHGVTRNCRDCSSSQGAAK